MVTQNTWRTFGKENRIFMKKKVIFVTAQDLKKMLLTDQPRLFCTCAPTSELPTNTSTMIKKLSLENVTSKYHENQFSTKINQSKDKFL